MPADRSTGRPSGPGTGPSGPLARPAAAGGGLLPIAGVRRLQGAGPRALDARAAAGPCSTGTSGAMRKAWSRGGSGAVAPGWSWTRPTPGAPGPSTAGGTPGPLSSPRGG
jgi:hypothetical protein